MSYVPGLWLFILAASIILGLFVYSWRFRNTETGMYFLLLMLSAWIWVFFFTLETATPTLQGKLFFSKIQFIGITFLPSLWVMLVFAYTGQLLPRPVKIVLLLIPVLTDLVVWTSPQHKWFFGIPQIVFKEAPFPILEPDYRFWFYFIHAPYGYICILIAVLFLLRSMRRKDNIYRLQGSLLMAAILLPAITDSLYVLDISPITYYNYTTAVFSLSGVILFWALFRFRFLDLLPLARDAIIDNLSDSILVFDHKKRIVYLNTAAQNAFKLSIGLLGQSVDEAQNEYLRKIRPLFQENQARMDIEIKGDNTNVIKVNLPAFYDARVSPVLNRQSTRIGWVAAARNITEHIQLFKQVEDLSIRDNLTGIFNRRHFLELTQRNLIRYQNTKIHSFTLVMIDLDHFKEINDTCGHTTGDRALTAFTNQISGLLRKSDLFGRLGGEEFGLLLNDLSPEEAFTIVERLRNSVEEIPLMFNGLPVRITASFGMVSSQHLDAKEIEIETLLQLADQALYQAKNAGRNSITIYRE